MKNHYLLFLFSVLVLASTTTSAQQAPMSLVDEKEAEDKGMYRELNPDHYQVFKLRTDELNSRLANAPHWQDEIGDEPVELAVPMPDGHSIKFDVYSAPVMEEGLAAKFPEIKSYVGYGSDDPSALIRFSTGPNGFRGIMLSGNHDDVFISPYEWGKTEYYMVYAAKDFRTTSEFQCMAEDVKHSAAKDAPPPPQAGDCNIRNYRLAMACNGEFFISRGNNQNLVMSEIVAYVTQINGILERDLAVHLNLVNNNDLLLFSDPATDPYTTNAPIPQCDPFGSISLGNVTLENQTTCDNIIGTNNYDIGHMLGTSYGTGGVASLRSVCNVGTKGRGASGVDCNSNTDPRNLQVILHEMGHQFGANHTQNNSCNRNNQTAMEPGSGTTIMSYVTKCPPGPPVTPDWYYHAISLQEMSGFLTRMDNPCATISGNGGGTKARAGGDYFIPTSTPFVLTAGEVEGGTASYCWEQINNEVVSHPPLSTHTEGPVFRSFPPTSSRERYFPNLQDIVNNVSPPWEVLPSVGRDLDFRVTVRDNAPGGGCTAEDDMRARVVGDAGPFEIVQPQAGGFTAHQGRIFDVEWKVAGTSSAPINCKKVDILLSIDGGFTYPIVLEEGITNDGKHFTNLPYGINSSQARIMVKCSDNIFFDINDGDFTMFAPADDFKMTVSPTVPSGCAPNTATYTVLVEPVGNYNKDVHVSAGINPNSGISISSPVIGQPPFTATFDVTNTGGVSGYVEITVHALELGAQPSVPNLTQKLQIYLAAGPAGSVNLVSPAASAMGVDLMPKFTWSAAANAVTYNLQLATDMNFSNIFYDNRTLTGTGFTFPTPLPANFSCYWRVRAINACGDGPFSSSRRLTTESLNCVDLASTDVSKIISNSGMPVVVSTLNVSLPTGATIYDINLVNLDITHSWINDLVVRLKNPAGEEITLFEEICGDEDNILINFDDSSPLGYDDIPCPPTGNQFFEPKEPLSIFKGQPSNGQWELTVYDYYNQNGGSLNSWALEVCYWEQDQLREENPTDAMVINPNNQMSIAPSSLQVYPNPAKEVLNVQFGEVNHSEVKIKVYNALGQSLLTEVVNADLRGNNQVPINIESLNPGVYLLMLEDGKQQQSISFVKSE